MRNKNLFLGSLFTITALFAVPMAASAMPADIEEAVSTPDYDAYAHTGNNTVYSDSELLPVEENYVATANAMIRVAPFGDILGSVTPGETYYVIGECPDCMWYKISGDISGYVYASYMVPKSEYVEETNSNTEVGENIRSLDILMTVSGASAVNVRTAPSRSGETVAVVTEGEEVHVTGNVLNTEWYQCKYKGETVYICDDYLKPELPQTMTCTVKSALNIHESASADARIIGTLKNGEKIKVSADENGWLRFSMADGTIGYVSDEYMAAI